MGSGSIEESAGSKNEHPEDYGTEYVKKKGVFHRKYFAKSSKPLAIKRIGGARPRNGHQWFMYIFVRL
jgi:hypothetical protein